jgi:hypothetical protein
MRARRRPAALIVPVGAATIVAAALGAIAIADDPPRAPRPLHEPLPGPGGRAAGGPLVGDTPRAGRNPTAFAAGDKVLPEPALEARRPGEPVFGDRGVATDRHTEDTPDRQTGADPTLHYVAVFNPDVVPFKRLSALDAVRDDYTMYLADGGARQDLAVGGTTHRGRDRFWGSLQIRLDTGVEVAIPSVAPDMKILSYEVEPPRQLVFSKDGADNFYVRTEDPGASGVHRLVFLADADAGYFAPSFPSGRYTAARIRREAGDLLRPLPAAVVRAARETHEKLGIDENTDLTVAFNRMVGMFRSFEAKPMRRSSGDIYRDLCDHKAGVCRHRAFAFMVTANALGIPTRYVTNEAHAFVEVWFPERGWQRVDLGGAALELEVSNAKDKTLHRPRADDPFTKPPEYSEGYTQLQGDISGLTDRQLRDKHKPVGDAPASGDFGDPSAPDTGAQDAVDPGAIGPDPSLPARTADPHKLTPRILVTVADAEGYRGETIHVEGRVDAGGKPLADRAVDVYLAPAGRGGEGSIPIGRGTTDADGLFSLDLDLPGRLELRRYELFVTTREDARHNGAISE